MNFHFLKEWRPDFTELVLQVRNKKLFWTDISNNFILNSRRKKLSTNAFYLIL